MNSKIIIVCLMLLPAALKLLGIGYAPGWPWWAVLAPVWLVSIIVAPFYMADAARKTWRGR